MKLPIGHEFDCGDTTLVLFEDPDARVLHPDVPYARGGIVGARCENVAIQLKYVQGEYFVLMISVLDKESPWLLQVPQHD